MSQWTSKDIPALEGRLAIVSGANSGIGYHTALELGRRGARVILACRSATKAQAAALLLRTAAPGAHFEVRSLDVSDLDSVRRFADDFKASHAQLDILCNNAGVVAQPLSRSAQGFELQMATNYFGGYALTGLLLERLQATPGARIVNVASNAHKWGRMVLDDLNWERRRYNEWLGYGQSKLAVLLHTYELQRRLQRAGSPLIAVAAHPGYAATNFAANDMQLAKSWLGRQALAIGGLFAHSSEMGALPSLYAATAADVRGGEYFGPGGLGEMRGYPRRARSKPASHDLEVARQLWKRSEELTGVRYEFG